MEENIKKIEERMVREKKNRRKGSDSDNRWSDWEEWHSRKSSESEEERSRKRVKSEVRKVSYRRQQSGQQRHKEEQGEGERRKGRNREVQEQGDNIQERKEMGRGSECDRMAAV